MSETTPGETPVERRLREMADAERKDAMQWSEIDCPSADAADAGREALAIAREGVPRYLQNGGCSNCGGVPHTDTCLIGKLAALLARCEGDAR